MAFYMLFSRRHGPELAEALVCREWPRAMGLCGRLADPDAW
jgi:hypothetical protein